MKVITAEEEYARNPGMNRQVVQELLDWVKTQPHLPQGTEFEMILCYYATYYNVEDTKKLVETYFTYRTNFKDIFTNMDITSPELTQAMESATLVILPGTTPEGYRIIFWRFNDPNPALYDHIAYIKLFILFCSTICHELGTCPGYIVCMDCKGAKFAHLLKTNLKAAMHSLKFVQDCTPIRVKFVEHVHFFLDKPFALVTPFIKKELLGMLKFRKHMRDIDTFPVELLPSDYPEGKGPPLKELREKWFSLMIERRDQFLFEEATHKIDESKRIKAETKSWFGIW